MLLVCGAVAGCTGSPGPSPQPAPSVAAARQLLAQQSAAIRAHDRARYAAGLDDAASSAGFRARALQDLANLAHVPLAGWSYSVVGPIRDKAAIRAATLRYHAPVLLLHVTLGYELAGIDRVPSRHDEYLVFVTRDGHTYLAGDDALAAQRTQSWVGPWRYGPLAAVRGRASLVLGPTGDTQRLQAIADATDAAVPAVTAVWGRDWLRRVAVLVPVDAAEFAALSGTSGTDVSAAAVTDGVDAGTGRPVGQRLVLNPDRLGQLSATGLGIVLRHEITHLATAADTSDITPRWLVEGFAEYVANLGTGQPVRVAAAELRSAVAHGAVPRALPSDDNFAASGPALARVYEQAWLACRLIAQRTGQAGLVRFYRSIGTALEPAAPALAHAFTSVLHEPESAFARQWRAYVQTQLS